MNLTSCLLIAMICFAPAAEERQTVLLQDGTELAGQVLMVADGNVSLQVEDEVHKYPIESVRRIWYPGNRTDGTSPVETRLVDGSLLKLHTLSVSGGVASLSEKLAASTVHDVSTDNVDYLGLSLYAEPGLADQFETIRASEDRTGDLLVFQREDHLDYLEGIIGDISEEAIGFRTGDRDVEAPRARISSVLYFHAAGRNLPDPIARVTTTAGSVLNLSSLQWVGNHVVLQTVCGAEFRYLPRDLVDIDFSSARYQFVSDLQPSTIDWQPLIFNQALIEYQTILNRPRFNESFGNQPLALDLPEQGLESGMPVFANGIAVKGGTRLVYQLEGQYEYLTGWFGFAPYATQDGLVEVVIQGDGNDLYREIISHQTATPRELNIPVDDVRRLTLIVNYHDGRNIGDIVHFCDLKVSK